jgi:hypothetical protein
MIWMHVSELSVDRLIAGEIAGADAAAMRDHAASCARCGDLLADALAVQRKFAIARPPLALPPPVVRRRTAVLASAGAALAAAFAVVIAWPHRDAAPVRTKGGAIVGFFVAHRGDVRRGAIREVVTPGDRIELATTTTEPVWFAAVSDDASGTRSVYAAPQQIMPGPDRVVPGAVELDDMLGPEIVTGVFCPHSFDVQEIPDDCARDRFTLVKVAR